MPHPPGPGPSPSDKLSGLAFNLRPRGLERSVHLAVAAAEHSPSLRTSLLNYPPALTKTKRKYSVLIFHIDKQVTPQKLEKSGPGLCSSLVCQIIIPIRDARAAHNWIWIRIRVGIWIWGWGEVDAGGGTEQTNQKSIKTCDAAFSGSTDIPAVTCHRGVAIVQPKKLHKRKRGERS